MNVDYRIIKILKKHSVERSGTKLFLLGRNYNCINCISFLPSDADLGCSFMPFIFKNDLSIVSLKMFKKGFVPCGIARSYGTEVNSLRLTWRDGSGIKRNDWYVLSLDTTFKYVLEKIVDKIIYNVNITFVESQYYEKI